jgi:uncharacterized protein (DUF433 family)
MAVKTTWLHLEAHPNRRTCQLFVRGRNLKVWPLVQPIVLGTRSAEQMAKDYRLPLEAVQEALDYYHENERAILREVEQEGDYLREAGLLST